MSSGMSAVPRCHVCGSMLPYANLRRRYPAGAWSWCATCQEYRVVGVTHA